MKKTHNENMFRVVFAPTGQVGDVAGGSTVMDAAQKAGISLTSLCGGEGTCGKCRVIIEDGLVRLAPNPFIPDGEIKKGEVLACRAEVLSDLRVRIPPQSIVEEKLSYDEQYIAGLGRDRTDTGMYTLRPLSRIKRLVLPPPTLTDNVSDLERVKRAFGETENVRELRVDLESIRNLPGILRANGFEVTVTYALTDEGFGVVRFDTEDPSGSYGMAVDIGTTSVIANLVDLASGKVLTSSAKYNSQIRYGEDVINRIIHAQEHEHGLDELTASVVDDINELIVNLLSASGIDRDDIVYLVATGNTVMIHLLLGIPPDSIRREPYIPVASSPPAMRAKDIGVRIADGGYIGFLPGCGAYVGSDITAGLVSSGMVREKDTCLLIDVGTNGEIVLGGGDWFICASASAGPAFEGAGTACGVRASSGAIERIRIDGDGNVEIGVIGGEGVKPKGICGSGYIDLVAELFTAGFLDRTGRFKTESPLSRLKSGDGGPEFVVVPREDSAAGEEIIITEDDIATLMRTKGAIFTAVEAILRHVGVTWADIKKIFISGGFGNYLDVERSITIGLLPDIDREKYLFIGNGSLAGARLCLLSEEALEAARETAKKMTYFDLSTDLWFMKEYTSSLFLPHTDTEKFPSVTVQEVR